MKITFRPWEQIYHPFLEQAQERAAVIEVHHVLITTEVLRPPAMTHLLTKEGNLVHQGHHLPTVKTGRTTPGMLHHLNHMEIARLDLLPQRMVASHHLALKAPNNHHPLPSRPPPTVQIERKSNLIPLQSRIPKGNLEIMPHLRKQIF